MSPQRIRRCDTSNIVKLVAELRDDRRLQKLGGIGIRISDMAPISIFQRAQLRKVISGNTEEIFRPK